MRLPPFYADVAGGGFVILAVGAVIFFGIIIAGIIVGSFFIIRSIKKKNANK